jgi:GTPase SAR1 family protein
MIKILPLGPPGAGKSLILNFLADGYSSNRF